VKQTPHRESKGVLDVVFFFILNRRRRGMEELRKERLRLRLKAIEVAKLAGIDSSRLSKIEHGWIIPREEEVERIKKVISSFAKNE